MRRLTLPAALLLAAAASACAPNPIVARDPVPAPGPLDAVVCRSTPLPLNAFTTDCRPVPAAPQVVLRARGWSRFRWRGARPATDKPPAIG